MLTEFFNGKFIKKLSCVLCVVLTLVCVVYAYAFTRVKSIVIDASFYFLVSDDTRVEAGAEFVKWDGGAGYLLEHDNARYVAFTVFLDEEKGEAVRKALEVKGKGVSLLQKGAKTLYFKGRKKSKTGLYISALRLFKSYIILLNDCIGRLESGMTQEACKRILKTLTRQFQHSAKAYNDYTAFAKVCMQSKVDLEHICQKTVYLKDLRFLLCWQAEKYVELCQAFSL